MPLCAAQRSGEDAARPYWHNTAWLYRAELPDERIRIRLDGGIPVVGIDTAYGWNFQLEETPDITFEFHSFGQLLSGSNAVQEVRINEPLADDGFFRWNISR